jgi:quercetin dioxygenase-like cupin family protein
MMKFIKITCCCLVSLCLIACKQEKSDNIEAVKLIESDTSWNGSELPKYPDGKPKITILKITIPPQAKLKVHKHMVINAGVLTKGELTVIDEQNNVLNLKAGDALVELVNTYHHGENKGNVPAEIIVFYAGTDGVPITVAKDSESRDH